MQVFNYSHGFAHNRRAQYVQDHFDNIPFFDRHHAGIVLDRRHSVPVAMFRTRMINFFFPSDHPVPDMEAMILVHSMTNSVGELEQRHFQEKQYLAYNLAQWTFDYPVFP